MSVLCIEITVYRQSLCYRLSVLLVNTEKVTSLRVNCQSSTVIVSDWLVVTGSLQKQRSRRDGKHATLPEPFIIQSCSTENCALSQSRSVQYIRFFADYSRPLIVSAIGKTYILVMLFFYLFSVHRFFDVPGPIFAKLCHTRRYVLK